VTNPGRISHELVSRLHEQSGAVRWGLTIDELRATLDESVHRAFPAATPSLADVERHLTALHIADLALARACAAGSEPAWEHFVREQRPALYRAADAIDPSGAARELADAIYADLFGLRDRGGVRQSLLRYFHGRSSLATWLRAVLSQRHVDQLRQRRRIDPLPDDDSTPLGSTLPSQMTAAAPDPDRRRFVEAMRLALSAALRALTPGDRLRLSCYYTEEMTLSEIGRKLGEHEATVSRHLTRIRREIRVAIDRSLCDEHGLDERARAECFRAVLDDTGALDLAELVATAPETTGRGKNPGQDRSR
jgi:RNA polymerase sigma factor (sigma-70 family)